MTDAAFPAEPFTAPTRITLEATPLAVVRQDGIRIDALSQVFDTGYAALGRLFAEGALVPTGPAVAVYYGDPMATFDLELGFPVAAAPSSPLTTEGLTVQASALPAGPAWASTHTGPYDGLGSGWQALARAVPSQPSGIWIESYVSDPIGTPAEELRTDLILPVRG